MGIRRGLGKCRGAISCAARGRPRQMCEHFLCISTFPFTFPLHYAEKQPFRAKMDFLAERTVCREKSLSCIFYRGLFCEKIFFTKAFSRKIFFAWTIFFAIFGGKMIFRGESFFLVKIFLWRLWAPGQPASQPAGRSAGRPASQPACHPASHPAGSVKIRELPPAWHAGAGACLGGGFILCEACPSAACFLGQLENVYLGIRGAGGRVENGVFCMLSRDLSAPGGRNANFMLIPAPAGVFRRRPPRFSRESEDFSDSHFAT